MSFYDVLTLVVEIIAVGFLIRIGFLWADNFCRDVRSIFSRLFHRWKK